tara:strand:+ start:490 stop:654 length:165 start_codon:yes stop_codon:yes gene_type:complete
LSEEKGINGLKQTAKQLHIRHVKASVDREFVLDSDESASIYFQGAASCNNELPS